MIRIINHLKLWGARQGDHAVRSAALFLPVLFVIGTATVGVTVWLLQLSGLMPQPRTYTLQTLAGATILFSAVITAVFASAHVWTRWLGHEGVGFIGLNRDVEKFFTGALWGTGLQAFIFAALLASTLLRIDSVGFDRQATINILLVTVSSLNIGFVEEIIFRGVLHSALRPRWGWKATAFVISICFSLYHFIGNSYEFPISAILGLLAGGMLFAWTREITGGLWIPIGIHFAWDAAIGWFNLLASKSPHFLMTTYTAPSWATGEFGISDWILILIFAASIWVYKSRYNRSNKENPQ